MQTPQGMHRTITLGGLYERRTFGNPQVTEHVYNVMATTGVVAQVRRASNASGDVIHFVHRDHLGNADAITTESLDAHGKPVGALVERGKYEPFGERRFAWAIAHPMRQLHAQRASQGFTGHEPDDATGLVNMRARLYDSRLARFISPDPLLVGLDSQSLNRYSYVWNSPVHFADPSGYQGEAKSALPTWCTGECYFDPGLGASGASGAFGLDLTAPGPAQPSPPTQPQVSDENSNASRGHQLSTQVDWAQDPEGGTFAVRRPIPGEVTLKADRYVGALISSDPTFDYLSRFIAQRRMDGVDYCESPGVCLYPLATISGAVDPNNGAAVSNGWLIDVAVTAGTAASTRIGAAEFAERYALRGTGEFVVGSDAGFGATMNAAGGKLWTSVGGVNQQQIARVITRIINRASGTRIQILTGVHGTASGEWNSAYRFFTSDLARFGKLPSVQVYNVAQMTRAEIAAVLRSQGNIIAGFCHSSKCLMPYY